ncbi:hypothetical protein ACGFZQ_03760 [Streptomyces sp. NPDC048254]|uniref:hypothetical protein n=1 Tax=Streptomyces sp. NPDC048254 TaxID=3365525 RepID=UPI0037187B3D
MKQPGSKARTTPGPVPGKPKKSANTLYAEHNDSTGTANGSGGSSDSGGGSGFTGWLAGATVTVLNYGTSIFEVVGEGVARVMSCRLRSERLILCAHRLRGGAMGLVLFSGDGDVSSPDVSWSYTGFGVFRGWLARCEGFALDDMRGFGGLREWSDVSTVLTPLLNHPDDNGPDVQAAECAVMLPRLQEIAHGLDRDGADPLHQRHIDDIRQLVVVLQFCVENDVELIFG